MLSILVGHAYFLQFDHKQRVRAKPYPPLATLQVAARLRAAGHRVALFDAMLAPGVAEYTSKLQLLRPQVLLLYEDNFNFLSKMCLGRMRQAACAMIAQARGAGVRVLAAGADASDDPQPYLRAGADVVLLGEGLATLDELIRRLTADPTQSSVDLVRGLTGVANLDPHAVLQRTPAARPATPAADSPERPAWDLVDIDRYRGTWQQAHGYFSLNMAASRGCPFRCAWCAKPIWGNTYLQRSPAEVAAEMSWLKTALGAQHIWFADDIFGFRADWVATFAQALCDCGGGLPFTIQTRADLVSAQMAAALRAAGCREVWIGAESGSQRILDAMHKGTTVSEICMARERLAAVNIRVGFFIQLGYLGEELEDLLATRDLIERALPDDVGVSVSYPLPGTRFFEQVKGLLGRQRHWRESDDLAMLFRGTYRSEFYRIVRDLLHERVNLEALRDSAPEDHERRRATLEARWRALLEVQSRYRYEPDASRALTKEVQRGVGT